MGRERLARYSLVGPGADAALAGLVKLAEMLIARRAAPDPDALADPAVPLKALVRGTS